MKKLAALLLVTTMAFSIVGCGNKNENENQPADSQTTETQETETPETEVPSTEEIPSTEEAIDLSNVTIDSSCAEILAKVYADAAVSDDMRGAMEYFQTTEITDDMKEYVLGTADVAYADSVYSAPMMSSIAYQCVVLRVAEGQDVEAAKQLLIDNADPIKWICVEAESVVVENVGDVILYIMSDTATAEAVKEAFLAMGA